MLSQTLLTIVSLHFAAGDSPSADGWITMKARLAILTTEGIKSGQVHVDTDSGVVTLYGRAGSAEAKIAAERAIAGLDGVKRVENMLEIVPPSQQQAVEQRDETIKKNAEMALANRPPLKSVKVLSVAKGVVMLGGEVDDVPRHIQAVDAVDRLTGVRRVETRIKVKNDAPVTTHYNATRGQDVSGSPTLSDAWLTTQVKMRLIGNEAVPALSVHVDTYDGVVTLFGQVDSDRAKSEAGKEAERVEGVVRVHNDLVVDTRMQRDKVADKDIEADVKRLLAKDSLESVKVGVKNGVIKLSGKVDTHTERMRAVIVSRTAKGARAVKNELEVTKREMEIPK